MRDTGFTPGAPTLWLAEGLFFSLAGEQIGTLLTTAARLSGPANRFGADVTGTAGLDSPALQPYRRWCADHAHPPPFGSDEPGELLRAGGWEPERITAPGAPDANHGRLHPRPGGLVPGRTHFVTGRLG